MTHSRSKVLDEKLNTAFAKLQKKFRTDQALAYFKQQTGIDIRKVSQSNLLKLYHRLRTNEGLSKDQQANIKQEKNNPHDTLTPRELAFFKKILRYPLILNHASFSADNIKKSNYLYSSHALEQNHLVYNTHTATEYGEDRFVFFSYDISQIIKVVSFLGNADVFILSAELFMRQEPQLWSGTWTSGHFYAYDDEQQTHTVLYRVGEAQTKISMVYSVAYTPLIEPKRTYIISNQNCQQSLSYKREDEISVGRHIKPFHLLRLIEFMRYFNPLVREAILTNMDDQVILGNLFSSFFTAGKAELHIPHSINYQANHVQLKSHEQDSTTYQKILNAVIVQDVNQVKSYLQTICIMQYNQYTYGQYRSMSLLNVAVRVGNYVIVKLLLDAGWDPDHIYANPQQKWVNKFAERSSLQDAVEKDDLKLIQVLCIADEDDQEALQITYRAHVSEIVMYTAIAAKVRPDTFQFLLRLFLGTKEELNRLVGLAAYYENLSAIQYLLAAGADIDASNDFRRNDTNIHIIPCGLKGTPLEIAASYGRIASVAKLLALGANVHRHNHSSGLFAGYGKGERALNLALTGLRLNMTEQTRVSQRYNKIDHPHYKLLPRPGAQNYLDIISLLRKQHAELFIDTNAKIITLDIEHYINEWHGQDAYLTDIYHLQKPLLPASEKKLKDYSHDSYAFITLKDAKQTSYLILGKEANSQVWALPGGTIDYEYDHDSYSAAISATAYQLGLNLVTENHSQYINYEQNNVDELVRYAVHQFELKVTREMLGLPSKTCCSRHFTRNRNASRCLRDFAHIQIIKMDALSGHLVLYKGVLYPYFKYEQQPIPHLLSPFLADYFNLSIDREAIKQIALALTLDAENLLRLAIKNHVNEDVKTLLAMDVAKQIKTRECLYESMTQSNVIACEYMLQAGIRLEENDLSYFINFNVNNDNALPENMFLMLYQYHSQIFNKYDLDRLAYFASCNNYQCLLAAILQNTAYPDIYDSAVKAAVANCQLATLKYLLALPQAQSSNLDKAILLKIINVSAKISFSQIMAVCEYLASYLTASETRSRLLQIVLAKTEQAYDKNALPNWEITDIQRVVMLIESLFNKAKIKPDDVETISGYWIRLQAVCGKDDNSVYLYQHYYRIFQSHFLIRFNLACHYKNWELVDELLEANLENNSLQEFFMASSYLNIFRKDHNGDNSLMRAVKTNKLEVVRFLLNYGFNNFEFKLNDPDKENKTPLEYALANDQQALAQLLIVHGAINNTATMVETSPVAVAEIKHIILASEAPNALDNLGSTGDVDYVTQLKNVLATKAHHVEYVNYNTKTFMIQHQTQCLPQETIFNLFINAPRTGFAVEPDYLRYLKSQGYHIVVTVIEFAKHHDIALKQATLNYLTYADGIVFLDENDKNTAIAHGNDQLKQQLEEAKVINVPATIDYQCIKPIKTNDNIICFGMLRVGKGFAHILQLAELIKNHEMQEMRDKKIYIVGTVQKNKTQRDGTAYDATLYRILCAMYPTYTAQFFNKSPQDLIDLYAHIKTQCTSNLPIELHLDVPADQLQNLFSQCTYAYYPAYRGATLRNSSISTCLTYGCIVYSHTTAITPACLRKDGEYHNALVMFDSDNYYTYAKNVIDDLTLRQKNKRICCFTSSYKSMNQHTRELAQRLVDHELQIDAITDKYLETYAQASNFPLPTNNVYTPSKRVTK